MCYLIREPLENTQTIFAFKDTPFNAAYVLLVEAKMSHTRHRIQKSLKEM